MAITKRNNTNTKKDPEQTFNVEVTRAKELDNCIAFDMIANGVKIYGCFYRTYEDRDKPGDEKAFISFPSRKGSDGKWYQHVWFEVSPSLLEDIEKQIEAKLK